MTSVLLVLAVCLGMGLDRAMIATGLVDASTQLTTSEEFTILEETYDAIRNNYVLEEEISDEELMYGAARGMVDALGDEGHSVFLDPQEAEEFEQSSRGELVGIGIQIDTEASPPVVIAPIPDSPALEAGLLPGDVILEVDGVSTEGLEPEEIGNRIRGEAGTDVTLTLQHEGEVDTYEVTITRTKIDVNPVSWALLPNNVLWVQVSQFSSGATEGLQQAIREGQALGATSVILDLRNNPGGLVFEAMGIASQFLPDGSPLYQEVDAEGNIEVVRTVGSNGVYQEGRLVVLVNEYSASASEIVSSSLMEAGRAPVLGEKTFGTGTVLLPFELSDGSMAVLGTELWLTGEGDEIYMEGVEPTETVELEEGTRTALPVIYTSETGDEEIAPETFEAIEDAQLHAAWEELEIP
ncbi:MAG TPA: S41 family peptidase [Thermomicrobiales bacterium]|nr:S41 family peptidase [Thermomicrobiales bacterium]